MAHQVNRNLNDWTDGERLWLWRHERELTGIEAAARLRMGRNRFWAAEADRGPVPRLLGEVDPGLPGLLRLARKRSGWPLQEAARRADCSIVTFLKWEREGSKELQYWWELKGFKF